MKWSTLVAGLIGVVIGALAVVVFKPATESPVQDEVNQQGWVVFSTQSYNQDDVQIAGAWNATCQCVLENKMSDPTRCSCGAELNQCPRYCEADFDACVDTCPECQYVCSSNSLSLSWSALIDFFGTDNGEVIVGQ